MNGHLEPTNTFNAWRGSEDHQRVAARMAQIADWWVGDWAQ